MYIRRMPEAGRIERSILQIIGLVEVITKKALRRFDSDTARFVKEGKLIVPQKPEKKKPIF